MSETFADRADCAGPADPGGRAVLGGRGGRGGPLVMDEGAARHFRSVLGSFATGVVIVTASGPQAGVPLGLTANSFTSVSLSPPLVSVCVAHTSSTWPGIRSAGGYCINILAEHQRGLCAQFAAPGGDKFRGVAWTASPAGHPILAGTLGWLDCTTETELTAGDHVIVICRVRHLDTVSDGQPLIFYRGEYGRFTPPQPAPRLRRRGRSPAHTR